MLVIWKDKSYRTITINYIDKNFKNVFVTILLYVSKILRAFENCVSGAHWWNCVCVACLSRIFILLIKNLYEMHWNKFSMKFYRWICTLAILWILFSYPKPFCITNQHSQAAQHSTCQCAQNIHRKFEYDHIPQTNANKIVFDRVYVIHLSMECISPLCSCNACLCVCLTRHVFLGKIHLSTKTVFCLQNKHSHR